MVREDRQRKLKRIGFRFLQYLHLDHRAVVADI